MFQSRNRSKACYEPLGNCRFAGRCLSLHSPQAVTSRVSQAAEARRVGAIMAPDFVAPRPQIAVGRLTRRASAAAAIAWQRGMRESFNTLLPGLDGRHAPIHAKDLTGDPALIG